MPAVVSDASVLICLGALRQLQLLRDFYHDVLVPDAVWREVTVAAASRPGAHETIQASQQEWLKVRTPGNRALVASLQTTLDAGEAEAIALASELRASLLLIDESDGRAQARSLGVPVTGTLGVLLRAKQTGAVPALKPLLDTLIAQHSFRLSRPLYERVLQQVGETP
jgi:uncharacterized protein